MPCDDKDNVDIPYLKKVFEFIEAHPNHYDSSKIWAEGFSQNSVFSAYLGFCFSDKVLGITQGGSGLAITGQKPYFPGCEGQVAHSDIEACHGNCEACIQTHPCNYNLLFLYINPKLYTYLLLFMLEEILNKQKNT